MNYEAILLEPAQKALLKELVAYYEALPADQRTSFTLATLRGNNKNDSIFDTDQQKRFQGSRNDVKILANAELLDMEPITSDSRFSQSWSFYITPKGFAYCRWLTQHPGQSTQPDNQGSPDNQHNNATSQTNSGQQAGTNYGTITQINNYYSYDPPSAESPTADSHPPVPPVREGENPFIAGNPVPPEHFYGRTMQREHIKNRIGGNVAECVSIVGLRRSGKSSLLRYIRERSHEFRSDDHLIIVPLDLQDRRLHTPDGINEGLRRGIERTTGSAPWQRDENSDDWAIRDGLEYLRDNGHRLLVLIDEFERIGARLDQFENWGDDWRSKASAGLLTLVIATLRPLDEIYEHCGLTSPFGNIFTSTTLGALESAAWQKLVRDSFTASSSTLSEADMQFIDDLAGGLPFYTQMAAVLLWQHGDHVRARAEFVRQATPRFAELWRDLHNNEYRALHHAAEVSGVPAPTAALRERLHDYGLLRANGRLFSSAFTDFVRGQA
jgi:hypothetical protein